MKKFVVIYHAPASGWEQMAHMTPEDMQKGMEPRVAWMARCGSALVDQGAPLVGGQRMNKSGSSASVKEVVGYSILQAEDMEAAKVLLDGHPHLDWADGCEIEVHEAAPMQM